MRGYFLRNALMLFGAHLVSISAFAESACLQLSKLPARDQWVVKIQENAHVFYGSDAFVQNERACREQISARFESAVQSAEALNTSIIKVESMLATVKVQDAVTGTQITTEAGAYLQKADEQLSSLKLVFKNALVDASYLEAVVKNLLRAIESEKNRLMTQSVRTFGYQDLNEKTMWDLDKQISYCEKIKALLAKAADGKNILICEVKYGVSQRMGLLDDLNMLVHNASQSQAMAKGWIEFLNNKTDASLAELKKSKQDIQTQLAANAAPEGELKKSALSSETPGEKKTEVPPAIKNSNVVAKIEQGKEVATAVAAAKEAADALKSGAKTAKPSATQPAVGAPAPVPTTPAKDVTSSTSSSSSTSTTTTTQPNSEEQAVGQMQAAEQSFFARHKVGLAVAVVATGATVGVVTGLNKKSKDKDAKQSAQAAAVQKLIDCRKRNEKSTDSSAVKANIANKCREDSTYGSTTTTTTKP